MDSLLKEVWKESKFDPERTGDVFKVGSGHRVGLLPARDLQLEFGKLCGECPRPL